MVMTRLLVAAAIGVFAFGINRPAAAQPTSILSQVVAKQVVSLPSPVVVMLREAHAAGDMAAVTETAKRLLANLTARAIAPDCCDYDQHYFEVAFLGRDDKGAEALVRILIHDPDPVKAVLPGLKGSTKPYFTVFVDESLTVAFRGTFDIERTENPLIKESGDFVSMLVGKFALPAASIIPGRAGVAPAAPSGVTYPTAVTILRTEFPQARATLTSKLFAQEPAAADSVAARSHYVALAESDKLVRPSSSATCTAFASAIETSMTNAAMKSCGFGKADDACIKDLQAAVTSAYAAGPAICTERLRIARAFMALAQSAPRHLPATTPLTNTPFRYVSFSLATTVVTGIKTDQDEPRAKLANGLIVADTFPRLLALGIVNVMPWGYDPEAFSPTWAERLRFTAGVGLAPYFGVSAGFAVSITRAVGLTFGRARLWYDTPRDGPKVLDTKPTGDHLDTPFRAAHTDAWIWGVTYTFK